MTGQAARTALSETPESAIGGTLRLQYDHRSGDRHLHRLWRRYLPLANGYILSASLAINILALALPILILQVYDRIIPNQAISTLILLSIGVALALALDLVLKLARSYLAGWAGARYEHDANRRAIAKLCAGRLDSIEDVPAGVHLDRLSSIELVREFYASQASLALVDLPFVAIFLALMAAIAGWLVMIPVILMTVAILLAWKLGNGLRAALAERRVWDDRRYSFIIEVLSGIHTIKAAGMEELMLRRYERLMQSNAAAGFRIALASGVSQSVGTTVSQLTLASVAGFGSLMVIDGQISIGALAACTLLAGRTVQPALRALSLWSRFQSVDLAEGNLDLLDSIPAPAEGEKDVGRLEKVALNSVSFRYGRDHPFVLNGINLSIEFGDTIGISGGNGVGKTTLLNLIAGQLRPTSGNVRINGCDASEFRADSLAENIAYLPQRPTLFNGTVLENLTTFRLDDEAIMSQALDLADRLGLSEIFARLPMGYDTRVGDTAAFVLPAGVAQRITIARALVGRPRLILFDEANNSLDGASDAKLRDLIAELKSESALILVSYRPSLLALAGRQYRLESGQLLPTDALPARKTPARGGPKRGRRRRVRASVTSSQKAAS